MEIQVKSTLQSEKKLINPHIKAHFDKMPGTIEIAIENIEPFSYNFIYLLLINFFRSQHL